MPLLPKRFLRISERPRILVPALLLILLTTLITLFQTRPHIFSESALLEVADANRVPAPSHTLPSHTLHAPPEQPPGQPSEPLAAAAAQPSKCDHVVLFSSARHGSTWFIDSVERCRYSRSSEKLANEPFASSVFKHTEPWKHKNSPLYAMDGAAVAEYASTNSSVKVFSSTMEINRPGVEALAREGARLHVPFVVLRREPQATFRSLRVAKETGVWNGVGSKHVGNVTQMDGFDKYKQSIDNYYARVHALLKDAGVVDVDVLDYDVIKELKYIRLEHSACYIRNCNFAD